MLSPKDVAIIYETLLSSPGMNDSMKIDLRMSRKNVLLLVRVIEIGLAQKEEGVVGHEEIKDVVMQLLTKTGLTETYDKINSLVHK
jgi:hypothetical protein